VSASTYTEKNGLRVAICDVCGGELKDYARSYGSPRFLEHSTYDCVRRLAEENVALRARVDRLEQNALSALPGIL
jgi:hypothetical protein